MNLSRSFVSGDKVWLDARNLHIRTPSKKLSHQRIGLYAVLQQLSPVTYCLQLSETIKINNVFYVDLLTLYRETNAYGPQPIQPPPELIDGEKEYKIEDIIDDRYNQSKRKRQYLVKWIGYPASENSWVNKQDLHSDELLADYRLSKA
jgi:Chromo (CHRromatin Organisation MOdifier) domain